jgi:hypothetical protein
METEKPEDENRFNKFIDEIKVLKDSYDSLKSDNAILLKFIMDIINLEQVQNFLEELNKEYEITGN